MNGKQHQFTNEGLENIKSRLKFLKEVARPRNIEALKEARAQGDLSENAEYDAAREEQATIEQEISELEEIVKNAVVIEDDVHASNIGKLITISFDDTKETLEFLLVSSSMEANPMEGRISKESPLGKAVYDANIGSKVTVKAENGEEFSVSIINIKNNK